MILIDSQRTGLPEAGPAIAGRSRVHLHAHQVLPDLLRSVQLSATRLAAVAPQRPGSSRAEQEARDLPGHQEDPVLVGVHTAICNLLQVDPPRPIHVVGHVRPRDHDHFVPRQGLPLLLHHHVQAMLPVNQLVRGPAHRIRNQEGVFALEARVPIHNVPVDVLVGDLVRLLHRGQVHRVQRIQSTVHFLLGGICGLEVPKFLPFRSCALQCDVAEDVGVPGPCKPRGLEALDEGLQARRNLCLWQRPRIADDADRGPWAAARPLVLDRRTEGAN
mmetsp:Transcript_78256/g.175014  ORF Transcript_78256/g.175014 Transcript_78256/m.175014 type:complete len:274 (-) Transcript_78256:144-965(-)